MGAFIVCGFAIICCMEAASACMNYWERDEADRTWSVRRPSQLVRQASRNLSWKNRGRSSSQPAATTTGVSIEMNTDAYANAKAATKAAAAAQAAEEEKEAEVRAAAQAATEEKERLATYLSKYSKCTLSTSHAYVAAQAAKEEKEEAYAERRRTLSTLNVL